MFQKLIRFIKDSDLYFYLFKRKQVRFRIEGACKMTGNCCQNLILTHLGKPIKSHADFDKLVKRNSEYDIFKPHEKVSDDGFLRCTCTKLGSDNKCTIYQKRPALCRRYPNPKMIHEGGNLLPGCGYKIVADQDFDAILDDEMKDGSC